MSYQQNSSMNHLPAKFGFTGLHVSSQIPWAGRPLTDAALYAVCKTQQACLLGDGGSRNQGSKAKRRLSRLMHDGHTALLPLALHSDRSRLFTQQLRKARCLPPAQSILSTHTATVAVPITLAMSPSA